MSYFPGFRCSSHITTGQPEEAFANTQAALQAFPDGDVFFGTGDHEALAALEASKMANRLTSRPRGKKILFISIDDSKEALTNVKQGILRSTRRTPRSFRALAWGPLNIVTKKAKMPHDVITPTSHVTQKGNTIFGLVTKTPDQWYAYTFGPPRNKASG